MFHFLVWTALAVLAIGQVAMSASNRGMSVPWRLIVPDRLFDWYSCAMLTPLLLWLVRRRPLDSRNWTARLPLYLAVTISCVLVKYTLFVALAKLLRPAGQVTLRGALAQNFVLELMIFWGVIAVFHAVDLQRTVAERDRLALELRARLSEAQLEVLKGQLQPHFLFNTLNGVASLIHTDPAAADLVVVQLGDLLRASLQHDGAAEIPLAEELALLDKYVSIMKARFGTRVSVIVKVDESVRTAMVPQFLLQPLVENAFEHGVGRNAGPGTIAVTAQEVTAGRLRLRVSDDGAGPPPSTGSEGVGLGNTRQRLVQLYGAEQSLTLSPSPGGGATTTVDLPFRCA